MDNLTRLFRIRKTCMELLRDRGYLITQVGSMCTSTEWRSAGTHFSYAAIAIWRTSACPPLQEDQDMTKDQFREKYGDEPRKDDLTILAPKQVQRAYET